MRFKKEHIEFENKCKRIVIVKKITKVTYAEIAYDKKMFTLKILHCFFQMMRKYL